ncbi:histidine phosphatase family protein [Streptomyces sp. NPDC003077]|uniref:histidine phosphatase family protein n=1 Tax=Streptomyces sp. NPDC003077 TaxID=3154443 RepID=UPI0033B33E43
MPRTATRYLYLARHGEATPDESGLTAAGRRQATLLGQRLRDVPLSVIHHGPLGRAEQTAKLIGEQLDGVPLRVSEAAGDYVPYVPEEAELPADSAAGVLQRLARFSPEERERGSTLARAALARFTGPVDADDRDDSRHELIVTHNFLIGWLVRAAHDAPKWRWLGLNHCNAALTVIRYAPDRPSSVLLFNDMRHLPAELRWTGFPAEYRMC